MTLPQMQIASSSVGAHVRRRVWTADRSGEAAPLSTAEQHQFLGYADTLARQGVPQVRSASVRFTIFSHFTRARRFVAVETLPDPPWMLSSSECPYNVNGMGARAPAYATQHHMVYVAALAGRSAHPCRTSLTVGNWQLLYIEAPVQLAGGGGSMLLRCVPRVWWCSCLLLNCRICLICLCVDAAGGGGAGGGSQQRAAGAAAAAARVRRHGHQSAVGHPQRCTSGCSLEAPHSRCASLVTHPH